MHNKNVEKYLNPESYVVMIGPRLLPTDSMIFEGALKLLAHSRIHVNEYLTINDSKPARMETFKHPTHIIVLGTPWVWDRCYESPKYENALQFFASAPNAKKLFLGVGSCLPLGKEEQIKASLISNVDKLAPLFQDSTVIVRDILAADILKPFNPTPLPCPAFYAMLGTHHVGQNTSLVWYDPTRGVSQVDWSPESARFEEYVSAVQVIYSQMAPTVYCVQPEEIAMAQRIGIGTPQVITGSEHAKLVIKNSGVIHSGRVHLAVPAYILGKFTYLWPVDSRARVLKDVVDGLICDPLEASSAYKALLQDFI